MVRYLQMGHCISHDLHILLFISQKIVVTSLDSDLHHNIPVKQ